MNRPKVLITIMNQSWIHKSCIFSLVRLLKDQRVDSKYLLPTRNPYVSGLNEMVKHVLENEYDFWISFDDDNPPVNNIIDLVFLDLDIVGCPTPVWANMKKGDYPIYFNALNEDKEHDGWKPVVVAGGLKEVDAIGSGCMVLSRRVLQQMDKPLFFRKWDENGIAVKGHDYEFCRKAKDKGFKVYTHFDYPCLHFHELEINEIGNAFEDLRQ